MFNKMCSSDYIQTYKHTYITRYKQNSIEKFSHTIMQNLCFNNNQNKSIFLDELMMMLLQMLIPGVVLNSCT